MSEEYTYDLPKRSFRPDWTLGYCLAVLAVGLFFCLSFILYSIGSVPPIVSGMVGLGYAVLIMLAATTMTIGGGGMATLPFFLIGSALFFGAGTYFSVTVAHSNTFFTEGQQWRLLPQVNLVNATAILCVVLAAGLFTARRPVGSEDAMPLGDRLEIMHPFLKIALALGVMAAGVEWLTFPNVESSRLASVISVLNGLSVFAVFLGCALWSKAGNYERGVVILLILMISIEGILSARKLTCIMPILAASLGLWVSERHRVIAVVLAALTVWLHIAMLSTTVPQIRAHEMYDPLKNSISERVKILSDVAESHQERAMEATHQRSLARFSPTQFSAHFIESYNNNNPGDSLDKVFIVLVPRLLWPEKPLINPGKHFDSVWRDMDFFSSLAIGFPAEAYWNDGWIGVIAVSMYIGVMLGWFSRKWFLFRRDGWTHCGIFILSPVLVKSAIWVESNIVGSYVGGWIKYALIILAIDYSVRVFFYLRQRFEHSFDDPLAIDVRARPIQGSGVAAR